MNRIESVLLTSLAFGVVFSWYYAIIILGRERNARETALTSGDSFPVCEWGEINAHELGKIEENIVGLTRVMVVAHRVEEPMNGLRRAVTKNLRASVQYHFLVSKSRAESEIDGWIREFLAIAHVVKKQSGSVLESQELVRISNLSFDWRDTPYVFYVAETSDGQPSTVAFRGNQDDEGIAERYTRLPGWLAYSMALAIFSDAPHPMTIDRPQFKTPLTLLPADTTSIVA